MLSVTCDIGISNNHLFIFFALQRKTINQFETGLFRFKLVAVTKEAHQHGYEL